MSQKPSAQKNKEMSETKNETKEEGTSRLPRLQLKLFDNGLKIVGYSYHNG